MRSRGLQLSPEKTCIAPIEQGFNFPGQNLRKHGDKMLIPFRLTSGGSLQERPSPRLSWDVSTREEVGSWILGAPLRPVEGQLRFAPSGTRLVFCNGDSLHSWRAGFPWNKKSILNSK
jgi:hypothetical protein